MTCVIGEASGVYPRERGGTIVELWTGGSIEGLSPRARGNVQAAIAQEEHQGSIPASAGERLEFDGRADR